MKIYVKFFVFDLPPGFKDAELEVNDGATVDDVIDACFDLLKHRQVTMNEKELRTATVLVGGKWSNLDDPVTCGDTITIIRPMDGG